MKKTYYEPNHFINTKVRNDFVIHNGTNASSSVGVIVEAKKPTNKANLTNPKLWRTDPEGIDLLKCAGHGTILKGERSQR